jgi:hypothetical protein
LGFTFALFKKARLCAITETPPKVIKKLDKLAVSGVAPILDNKLQPFVNSISPTDTALASSPLDDSGEKMNFKINSIGYRILKSIKISEKT